MVGVRYRSLFTSRWMALLWALLVILTAINVVGTDADDTGGDNQADQAAAADGLTAEQRQAIMNAL